MGGSHAPTAMADELPPGREPETTDRAIAWCWGFLFAVSALLYSAAVPYPTSLQRFAAALAAIPLAGFVAWRALRGRGFPVPPLAAATIGIAAAMLFTAALPRELSFAASADRAWLASATAAGLVVVAAIARSLARAHLGSVVLGVAVAVGAIVAAQGLAEATGLADAWTDAFGGARYYDRRAHPYSTLGNPDLCAELLAPLASIALALAAARGGAERALALGAAVLMTAYLGRLGVRFGTIALAIGVIASIALTVARVRRAGGGAGIVIRASAMAIALLGAAWVGGTLLRPAHDAPAESAPARESRALPASLEVRARVDLAAAKLALACFPWGTGAGNFALAFPLQRDREEIELSTHGRRDSAESVVDVAHNDPLQFVVETGAPGLVALGALLVGLFRWGRRRLFSATANTVAASAGLAALAIASIARAPFYDGVASALLGAAALGVVGAADGRAPERIGGIVGRSLGVVLALALVLPAWIGARGVGAHLLLAQERVAPTPGAARLVDAQSWSPTDERIPLIRARRLRGEGDAAGALAAYDEAVRRHPFLVQALLDRGVLHAKAENLTAARLDFEKVALLDPNHPALALNRAQLARAMGDDAEAARLVEQAAARGGDLAALRQWGIAYVEAKEFARARPYLDKWLAKNPDDADAWFQLGSASLRLGRRADADLELARAQRLYALDHLAGGRLDAASRAATLYRSKAPADDAGPSVIAAAVALARGDRAAAVAALDTTDPKTRIARRELERAELRALLDDAELGPRVRALARD